MTAPDDVVDVSPARPPRRPGRTTAIVAVFAVLVALGGVVTWVATRGGSSGAAGGALACPASVSTFDVDVDVDGGLGSNAAAVPSRPTASGTDGRLVPDRMPTSLLLCEYVAVGTAVAVAPVASGDGDRLPITTPTVPEQVALSRSAEADGDDAGVGSLVATLRGAAVETGGARLCATPYPGESPSHVVGLTYDDGVVWLSTPDLCAGTTNGVAEAPVSIGPDVALALDAATGVAAEPPATVSAAPAPDSTGASPDGSGVPGAPGTAAAGTDLPAPDVPVGDCLPTGPVAAGDDDGFVPFDPVGVRICHVPVDPSGVGYAQTDHPAEVAVDLATTIDGLPLQLGDVCPAIGGEVWDLLFTAAVGQQAHVLVDAGGCGSVTDGVRVAVADAALYARLDTLA